MILVDSAGWIEFFTDGRLASKYEKHLNPTNAVIVPSVVFYEVYKVIKRERSEEDALLAVTQMQKGKQVSFTEELALDAADISLQYHLAMADAMVYATAVQEKVKLATSDRDLKDLPDVIYYPKA